MTLEGYRIALGFDIHRTKKGVPLILGGCELPCEFGLVSATDGDVVLHALIDALLACASLPDIGSLFPSEDEEYRGMPSTELLASALQEPELKRLRIQQVDVTILAEAPRLSPYYAQIKSSLALLLKTCEDRISVKARSFEGIGQIGKQEAIGAIVLVLAQLGKPASAKPNAKEKEGESLFKSQREKISSPLKRPANQFQAISPLENDEDMRGALRLFVDGGSRGNPGPSACAFILYDQDGKVLTRQAKRLGINTNNVAEYSAVIFALEHLIKRIRSSQKVILHLDSKLVHNQLAGRFRVKDEKLWKLFGEVAKLARKLPNLRLTLIPRGRNSSADRLVKEILDREADAFAGDEI